MRPSLVVEEKGDEQHVTAKDRRRDVAPLHQRDGGLLDQFAQREILTSPMELNPVDVGVVKGHDGEIVHAGVLREPS